MKNHMKHVQEKETSSFLASTRVKLLSLFSALFLIIVLVAVLFSNYGGQRKDRQLGQQLQQKNRQHTPVTAPALFSGDRLWKNNIPSFLFGTNDTQEWTAKNVETDPAIQHALKSAHFTLMRTFFFDKSLLDGRSTSDAEIDRRLQTIANSGMTCLGVLDPILNPTFIKHVVAYAAKRCNIYEYGNEPDNNGLTMQQYTQSWNSLIPQLRKINPHAKFIGPVVADFTKVQPFLDGVKASGVLPDAISFHWYPCGGNEDSSSCLAKVSTFAKVSTQVKEWVRYTLGKDLPVGITEWNYNADNPPASYGNDPTFIAQFTTSALHSMMQAGVNFANQFDAASGAGSGGLDMFNIQTGQPKPQYNAVKNLINQYILPTSSLAQ